MAAPAESAKFRLVTLGDHALPEPPQVLGEEAKAETTSLVGLLFAARKTVGQISLGSEDADKYVRLITDFRLLAELSRVHLDEAEPASPPITKDLLSQRALALGAMILLAENLHGQHDLRLKGITDRDNVVRSIRRDTSNHLLRLERFVYAGELYFPIEGMTILDILAEPKTPQQLASYLRFFTRSALIATKYSDVEDIAQTSQDSLTATYPIVARDYILSAGAKAFAIIDLPLGVMEQIVQTSTGKKQEAAHTALRLMRNVHMARRKFYDALLKPESAEFSALKPVIEHYQGGGQFEEFMVLYILGLLNQGKTVDFYRGTRQLENHSSHGPFFRRLRPTLKRAIRELPLESGLLTSEDLPVVDSNTVYTTPAALAFPAVAPNEYELGKEQLAQMSIPFSNLRIVLNPNNSARFEFSLSFQDKKGQERILRLDFDARTGAFDWNLLEAPEELPDLRNVFVTLTKQISMAIQKQTMDSNRGTSIKPNARTANNSTASAVQLSAAPFTETAPHAKKSPNNRAARKREKAQTSISTPERWEEIIQSLSNKERRLVEIIIKNLRRTSLHALRGLASERVNGRRRYEAAVTTQLFLVLEEIASTNGGAPSFRVVAVRRS